MSQLDYSKPFPTTGDLNTSTIIGVNLPRAFVDSSSIMPADKLKKMAADLIREANRAGYIVTIDTQSIQPLAMGNVIMVADVRMNRNSYRPR